MGGCMNAICSENATLVRSTGPCPTTAHPVTTFDFNPPSSSEYATAGSTITEAPNGGKSQITTTTTPGRMSSIIPVFT